MSRMEEIYRLAMSATRPLLSLPVPGSGKLARSIRGRRDAAAELVTWSEDHRQRDRPLVWFHAPSVGEGLQARAVLDALAIHRPSLQRIYTHFSPSAEPFARSLAVDAAGYLPWDAPGEIRRTLDALRPDVIVFSKTDVWPVLTREAAARRIPTLLLNATLPAGSSRLRPAARALLGPAYRRLACIAAISEEDGDRFTALGASADRIVVMGDARFDQVRERAEGVDPSAPLLRRLRDPERRTIVAGSTWPGDEERLVPAFARVLREGLAARLILVPHEPTRTHLAGAESRVAAEGLTHVRLSALESDPAAIARPEVVVVDRIGILGELYALGDLAYVGGGFGAAGLHSVLEPAAFGIPVIFGPLHENAREAGELVGCGAARVASDPEALAAALRIAGDPDASSAAGTRARDYVRAGSGAALRGAGIVERYLPS